MMVNMPSLPRAAPPPPAPRRRLLALIFPDTSPLDLRLIGRTLLHAALVGVIAGLMSVLFFGALELVEGVLLGQLAGYTRLRAHGESVFGHLTEGTTVRLWLLPVIPALGALAGGILTARLAPEAAGGGGDAMIEAFHKHGGMMRKRVAWVKALASILTLSARAARAGARGRRCRSAGLSARSWRKGSR